VIYLSCCPKPPFLGTQAIPTLIKNIQCKIWTRGLCRCVIRKVEQLPHRELGGDYLAYGPNGFPKTEMGTPLCMWRAMDFVKQFDKLAFPKGNLLTRHDRRLLTQHTALTIRVHI
jgi:hypothetical protein